MSTGDSSSAPRNLEAERLAARFRVADSGEWSAVVIAARRLGWDGPTVREVGPASRSAWRKSHMAIIVDMGEDVGGFCPEMAYVEYD